MLKSKSQGAEGGFLLWKWQRERDFGAQKNEQQYFATDEMVSEGERSHW